MQKGNLNVLIEFEERSSPKVLLNGPGYRMVMLSLRARQTIPEHASRGMVTVYVIAGHITLFAGPFPDELYAGQVICIESSVRTESKHSRIQLCSFSSGGTNSFMGAPKNWICARFRDYNATHLCLKGSMR